MYVRTARELGLIIRERRLALSLDQHSLSKQVGVSRQWIVAVEKGKPRAEVELLLRTLNILGLRLLVEDVDEHEDASTLDIDAVVERARRSGE